MTNEKFIAREKPEVSDPWIAYTPENINFIRMATLKSALKLEIAGLKRRGRSVYSIIKEDFGKLKYGSDIMNITFDPTISNEMASYMFDDVDHAAALFNL